MPLLPNYSNSISYIAFITYSTNSYGNVKPDLLLILKCTCTLHTGRHLVYVSFVTSVGYINVGYCTWI